MPVINSRRSRGGIFPKEQRKIFNFADQRGIDLTNALSHFGRTLDDLVYERSYQERWNGPSPPTLSDYKKKRHQIPLVSFFTGCGGIDLGFEIAGFQHIAAFEFNELFCKTLRKNRPSWNVFGPPTASGDVSKVSEVIEALDSLIPKNFEGVFTGGPPCHPFSIAANQRFAKWGDNFKRIGFNHKTSGNLLFDYTDIIKHFRPVCFLIENVPGLRDLDGGKQLLHAVRELEAAGYAVEDPVILNAANYGVPQYRERLFVVGTRKNKSVEFPYPHTIQYGAGAVLKRRQGRSENTEIREHRLNSVKRYSRLDYGERDQLGRVDRLAPKSPSKTVIAGGLKGGGRSHLHPEIPRTLSVRECARLQTFPDDYIFLGPMGRQFTQVGNAVPPILAAQFGLSLAKSVFGVNHRAGRSRTPRKR